MTALPIRIARASRLLAGNAPQVILGLALLALVLTGCRAKTGTYAPVDLFAEMHYNQSVRSQEPPRLAPPLGAVPTSGREVELTREEYLALENPVARDLNPQRGAELFRTNCSFCHGLQGLGDGPVSDKLVNYGGIPAADLTGPATTRRTDGDIFSLISQGGALETVFGMPRFRAFLGPTDRWLLVNHIRTLQGQ